MAMTTDATTARRPNRQQRRDLDSLPKAVRWLIQMLGLDPNRRYDQGVLRVSSKGAFDKLEDQQGTGVSVYADNPDFQALEGMKDVRDRNWLPIRYSDVGGKKSTVFAWVGVVGNTIFVAAADSAAEANIEAPEDDIQGVGRNAYLDLLIGCARAGHVENIWLPFFSRMWRKDLWGEMLLEAVNRHLPGCTVWGPAGWPAGRTLPVRLAGRRNGCSAPGRITPGPPGCGPWTTAPSDLTARTRRRHYRPRMRSRSRSGSCAAGTLPTGTACSSSPAGSAGEVCSASR